MPLHPKASPQLIVFAFWAIACTSMTVATVSAAPAQNLIWQQADVSAKYLGKETNLLNLNFDVYHSGRVDDLLILASTSSILVGAERGGVWLVSPNGSALALSNSWDRPDINTMTFGFGNQKHVFAGGSGLYVTDYNSLFPYLSWFDISPQGNVLPRNAIIYKVATVTYDTGSGLKYYVVIATSAGIWTSELPPTPAGPYNWQQASSSKPFEPYSGLAAGPDGTGVIVAGFFKALSNFNGTQTPGILRGTFDSSGTLTLAPVNIAATASTASQPGMIGYVSLDACASQASRMYASVYDTNGQLFDVLRSDDTGANWNPSSRTLDPGDPNNTINTWDGMLGGGPFLGTVGAGGWIKHISVSPTDPNLVSIPGLRSIKTLDAGATWQGVGGSWSSKGSWTGNTMSYHDDWHVIRFFPNNSFQIYAGTDGGLLSTLGAPPALPPFHVLGPNYFYSNLNSRLHTMEFLSNPNRGFEGESDTLSSVVEGLIAGGTQDNGDIYVRMNPLATAPWTQLQGCDGGQNQFFNVSAIDAWVLHTPICGAWYPVVAAAILNIPPLFVTNVEITPPVKKDPNGNKRPEGLNAQIRSVYRPTYKQGNGLMFAIAGEQASIKTDSFPNSVFGLFADPKKLGTDMEWELLGNLPVAVTTCAAYDGDPVVCGGADGNIYTLDPKKGNAQIMPMIAPFQKGTANRILFRLPALPIAAYSTFAGNTPQGAVLQFNGVQWNRVLAFNDQPIQDIQVDESVSPEVIYVATDNRIYSSPDAGKNWFTDSKGLPERFHGSQLKIVRYPNGEKWLYLTTYGRSVWAANMAGGPITH